MFYGFIGNSFNLKTDFAENQLSWGNLSLGVAFGSSQFATQSAPKDDKTLIVKIVPTPKVTKSKHK